MPPEIRVTLCATCPAGRGPLSARLETAAAAQGTPVTLGLADCMSGCTRPSTIAFRARDKMAYLFGEVGEDDLTDLLTFLRLYAASPDGRLDDARPLGALRLKAIARIPG